MIIHLKNSLKELTTWFAVKPSSSEMPLRTVGIQEQPAKISRQRGMAVMLTGGAVLLIYVLAILASHLPGAEGHDHKRCILMMIGAAITIFALVLGKQGKHVQAVCTQCFGLCALYVVLQAVSQVGIRTPGGYVLLLFIPISGFVGGRKTATPVFAVVMAILIGTYLAEKLGLIRGTFGGNVSVLEAVLVIQVVAAIGLFLLQRVTGDALDVLSKLPSESNKIISHELRQPLSGIYAAVQVLSHPYLSDGVKTRTLKSLNNAATTMMSLLEDLGTHGQLASGDMTLTEAPFSPAAVAQDVYSMYEGSASQKGLTPRCKIELPEKLRVLGDANRLTQILSNLISNAVKFTEHGEVTLGVHPKSGGGNDPQITLHFFVMDTGVGIGKDRQKQLFNALNKPDDDQINQTGMGLGLSIAKHLTTAMGGKIGFESSKNRGSLFWVELTLERIDNQQVKDTRLPLPISQPKTQA